MKTYTSDKKITIGLFGHNSSGKTSFAEAMFFNGGLTTRIGKISEGNTLLDFGAEEKTKNQSVNLGIGYVEHNDTKIQILDAPGFLDFQGEIISGLYATDIAALFVNPGSAIEVGLEKAVELIDEMKVPSFFIINGVDKENSEFNKAFEDISVYSSLGIAPITLPMGEKGNFKGIINLLDQKAYIYKDASGKPEITEIPDEYKEMASKFHERMVEAIAEASDELTEKYLETMELDQEDIKKGLKLGMINEKFRPLFTTSATKNAGVNVAADIISNYFPKYNELGEMAVKMQDKDHKLKRNENEPLSGFVFKTISDQHLGDIINIKITSGKIDSSGEFYNVTKEKLEKAGQIYWILGDKKREVPGVSAGDIASFVKLKVTETKDAISTKEDCIIVKTMEYPEPIYSIAIQPKSKDDQEKISIALQKLNREDPSFNSYMDKEFGEFILSGMGDSHLNMILEKVKTKFGVEVDTATPQVPFRETITIKAEARGRYKKQTGGHGQFGDTYLRVEPNPEGYEFVNAIVGGSIPRNYIPSVEKGVKGAMEKGVLAEFPIVNIKVTLFDGSYHSVDSSDMAFQIAGSLGFKEACKSAKMILLEPIYDFEIIVPEENQGDIMGDLSGRRGKIQGTDQRKGHKIVVKASVPLAEMFTYLNTLKSMTGGRGFYTMKFSHYEPVPQNISKKIIEVRKKESEKE